MPAFALVTPMSPAAIPGLQGVFAGTRPDTLGVSAGQLAPCPDTPNCVASQAADPAHAITPLAYGTSRDQARDTLTALIQNQPRTQIIEQTEDYLYAECRSRLLGFVDDVEFYLPPQTPVIEMRSASRLGQSDLGVNRRRLEQIRLAMQELGVGA
ncbi:DUF1499 domain-containing protein [Synechococcales cyanobacterium C]|uniref:DUF1499 domain-containing protein n=2 Tax=Petrachloros TaxID=2918834 RepID=A0A8K2A8I0_9CYAN|nr:DUF1499 domain-containing protein [Petrachloros mirabilis ULC683]